jgi:Catenin-beta-like, Arm-motif containing nuclear
MDPPPDFMPSATFQGSRAGYVFKREVRGVGYYLDTMYEDVSFQQRALPKTLGKRQRQVVEEEDDDDGAGAAAAASADATNPEDMALEDLDEETLARMLEKANEVEVTELDVQGLRQLLVGLERKINTNQRLRIKHPDEPDKFLASEVDLDDAIKSLAVIATGEHATHSSNYIVRFFYACTNIVLRCTHCQLLTLCMQLCIIVPLCCMKQHRSCTLRWWS